jgi:hypothetical protein
MAYLIGLGLLMGPVRSSLSSGRREGEVDAAAPDPRLIADLVTANRTG